MRFLFPVLFLLAGALASAAPVEAFKFSAPLTLELRNAQWFDGQGWKKGTLYVAEGKFSAQKPKRVNRSMTLKGQYLIAPLAEAHNHNLQNDWGLANFAARYLLDGVFYAFMPCADPSAFDPLRDRIDLDDTPDVVASTACITSSDGWPLATLPAGSADKAVLTIDNAAEIERKWPQVLARQSQGGEWITVTLSYHERSELRRRADLKGRLGMDPDVVTELTSRAHKAGLRVAANVDSAADFSAAVAAGVDLITQMPGYFNLHGDGPERFMIKPEQAEAAARRQVAVATTTASTLLFKATPERLAMLRQVQLRNLETLKAAGVTLLLGSDSLMETAQAELHSLEDLGVFSPAELLKLATVTTARTLFPQRRLGCFEPGCEASFLLLGSDPLEDSSALDMPLLRVKQGRLLSQSEEVAEAGDKTSIATGGPPSKKPAARKKAPAKRPAGKPAPKAPAKSTTKPRPATAN
ncbi:MAG TPA: amidohydrolase family protein [Burkholderiaceae bacterium]